MCVCVCYVKSICLEFLLLLFFLFFCPMTCPTAATKSVNDVTIFIFLYLYLQRISTHRGNTHTREKKKPCPHWVTSCPAAELYPPKRTET